jgi:hypothetical protein
MDAALRSVTALKSEGATAENFTDAKEKVEAAQVAVSNDIINKFANHPAIPSLSEIQKRTDELQKLAPVFGKKTRKP